MLWLLFNVSERSWTLWPRFFETRRSLSPATRRRSPASAACSCRRIGICSRSTTRDGAKCFGQWGLPGGRVKDAEKPKACLRRELIEELGCRVPYLVRLGDWLHNDEQQRVFGCEIEKPIDTFDAEELRAIGWFSYEEVVELAAARKLRMGFELAAVVEFRRWHAANDR